MSQAALARLLGISEPSLSAWKYGRSRPEIHYRLALERLIGIPHGSWMTFAEKRIARASIGDES